MNFQGSLFIKEFVDKHEKEVICYLKEKNLDPQKLRRGKHKCFGCDRKMEAFGYNLDDKLVAMGMTIFQWCVKNKTDNFHSEELFGNTKERTQFQKLKCFGIIRRKKKAGWWELTYIGKKFLSGRYRLPSKVWIFDDKVILEEDDLISVEQADPRWKIEHADWINDYIIIRPYNTKLALT